MAKALENMIRFGVTPSDAIYIATTSPAESVNETLAGRIVPGAPATMTRWDKAWNMVSVIG
jgi:N-acetylglucosamine-6-phosphate deacetylase